MRRTVLAVFAAGMCSLIFIGVSFVYAADDGMRLPNGGGEPGSAYTAIVDAAYKQDYQQMCRLMGNPADVASCVQQKDALNAYIAMLTQPKSQSVTGGFMKGDEARLDVAYTFASAPQSTGFVVMKKMSGKWVISQFGGSGSGSVSATASGQADLRTGAVTASAGADTGEFAIIHVSPNAQKYAGKCPATVTYKANITFKMPVPDAMSYHWERSDGTRTPDKKVAPPRTGHMSISESWRGGKPGEEQTVSMRFVAESNGALMMKDPPGVQVICR